MISHAAGLPLTLTQNLPSLTRSTWFRNDCLASLLRRPLDRVNILGDEGTEGHSGCVNALSWARDGELLLSGGDDTTVRIWRMDPSESDTEYPFVCCAVIHTGHRANIFNARMLPHSSRIATVAGDKQVLVFDIGEVHGPLVQGYEGRYSETPTHTLRCHEDRVKRIVTEDSPDVFLTVSEDGTVRQHDLRTSHPCRTGCPAPLVQVDFELTSLAMSPLTPYQFVVAGDSPHGFLFDRRHLQTTSQPSSVFSTDLTTCVKQFGRPQPAEDADSRPRREHITGARMSSHAGDEVLLAYSGDVVYRYSTLGVPEEEKDTPTIMPIQKYIGARNIDTVKDVNFLGPSDEYVTVGSDDGNFFVWSKESGNLHGIYEGDGSVVNVIEGHPHLPLVAVSGIDTTVKLFAPTDEESKFSRIDNAEAIVERNQRSRSIRSIRSVDMAALMQLYEAGQVRVSVDGDSDVIPCRSQ